MSEHRTVVLLNTETSEEVRVVAKLREIPPRDLINVTHDDLDSVTVNIAAEKARDEYAQNHDAHFLVVGIERGDD